MKVHTIDLGFQGIPGVMAAFLVESEGELALIETGPGSTLGMLREGIRELGFAEGDIRKVLVTHIHLDHAGAAGWWACQGATIYVHPKGARHLADPSRLMESARMVYGDRLEALWGEMIPALEDRLTILNDGDTVAVGGVTLTALDTPGHARHHHAYVTGDACFAGDVAGARLQGQPYLSVTSAPPQFDPEAYDASLRRLIEGGYGRLYLTHFGEFTDGRDHLEAYRQEVRLASEFVRERIDEGMTDDELAIAFQAWNLERAFREEVPGEVYQRYEACNPSRMCAEGIALYWRKKLEGAGP